MDDATPRETPNGAFSIRDFCHWAGLGRTAVYEELKAGRLTPKKCGRRTIIPRIEAERWLATLPDYTTQGGGR